MSGGVTSASGSVPSTTCCGRRSAANSTGCARDLARRAILEAALDLVIRKGFAKVTIEAIAAQAGVRHGPGPSGPSGCAGPSVRGTCGSRPGRR
ncbi:TetR/AcrR family transcriptional regulator [Streptomyces sp. NPDC096094]|uniref:TetR/AcrR family transcriptional regulator n=1 Tax=Streptomyces sp. NPDC096094 TaxID=3366073 RepID=UPI0038300117